MTDLIILADLHGSGSLRCQKIFQCLVVYLKIRSPKEEFLLRMLLHVKKPDQHCEGAGPV